MKQAYVWGPGDTPASRKGREGRQQRKWEELGTVELGTVELGTVELGTVELGTKDLGTGY